MRFTWWDADLEAFDHPYNTTIENERAVEIAIAQRWATALPEPDEDAPGGLEVGNVLAHYDGFPDRRIIDLYEEALGVENLDVLDVTGGYDWIVAISTLEHVRWDHRPFDASGAIRALHHLRRLLHPGGRMLVTVPGGHHAAFDAHLSMGAGAARFCTLVRTPESWVQTRVPTFSPYSVVTKAESVWIGEWEV
jgi:hypothetical protein